MLPRVYEKEFNFLIRVFHIFIVRANCSDQRSYFHEIGTRSGYKYQLHDFSNASILQFVTIKIELPLFSVHRSIRK